MTDLRINDDFELLVSAGDFVVSDSNQQHIACLLKTNMGELKQFPTTGVGIDGMLLGDEIVEFKHRIKKQLSEDGATVQKIDFVNNKFTLDANYNS